MYSGLVLTKYSGRLMGAHQKIDRISRRHMAKILDNDVFFPTIKEILEFEGKNGPDGIKRKSPGRDEPWHYLNPLSKNASQFMDILQNHYEGLIHALRNQNRERAAFEAAWLAHAVVDGLTPAHHYPYEEKIAELRKGKDKDSRTTISEKLIFKGDRPSETFFNTMKAYGPKGLFTAHSLFEMGFTVLIRPLRLPDALPDDKDLNECKRKGAEEYFLHRAREVAVHGMFDAYLKKGWTPKLSNQIRHVLAPTMARTVTVLWCAAALESER